MAAALVVPAFGDAPAGIDSGTVAPVPAITSTVASTTTTTVPIPWPEVPEWTTPSFVCLEARGQQVWSAPGIVRDDLGAAYLVLTRSYRPRTCPAGGS